MSNALLYSSQYQNYRPIELIVIHCSATRSDRPFPLEAVIACHRARGFATIGYHYYLTRDGTVHAGRPLYQEGAHVTGYNRRSIGICYEGGLNPDGIPADTRTEAQKESLLKLLHRLKTDYPQARIVGHHDLDPHKACPCFEVRY
ncbi:MAG: N-acetylmuramoyl-L-alanine amidase [Bacteroides sp.]|nr:N-acetylmuramoyl-L-alanine amidase [Bacteroides sp.]